MVEINKIAKDQVVLELSTKLLSLIGQLFFVKYVKNIEYIIDQSYLSSYTPAKVWLIQNQQLKELEESRNRRLSIKQEKADIKMR